MARKSGAAHSARQETSMIQQSQLEPSQAMNGQEESSTYFIKLYGTSTCPECRTPFSRKNMNGQPVQEGCCKHVKCRKCLISNQAGCIQCLEVKVVPEQRNLRSCTARARSTRSNTKPGASNHPPITNGFHHQNALLPAAYSAGGRESCPQPPNLIPSTISTTACAGLGIGAGLTNGFHEVSPPPPSTVTRKRLLPIPSNGVQKRSRLSVKEVATAQPVLRDAQQNQVRLSASAGKESHSNRDPVQTGSSQNRSKWHSPDGQDKTVPTSRPCLDPPPLTTVEGPKSHLRKTTVLSKTRLTYGLSSDKEESHAQFAVTITPTDYCRTSQPELPLKKRHSPNTTTADLEVGPSSPANDSAQLNQAGSLTSGIEENEKQVLPQTSKPQENTAPVPKVEGRIKKKRNPVTIHDHISILNGDPPLYQCGICTKKFKTKAHIKYHEFCVEGEKPFKCEECGQGFIAKSHFEYHIRTHTGERPYTCPKCGKGFNQRGKVTRHMRSHTGEKPFVCTECGRGFANTQAMRSHFLIHTGERPFACEYCDKRFTGMTNLKKHVITHTGERPFMCTHCGKSFGLKWTLDLHLRTHSSERPFACDQCSRAFSNSKDLRRHMVIHSGERPFKCWICGTAFRRKDNLDRHIKNTHNQPKEVAKHLANEAAAEYLAASLKKELPKGGATTADKGLDSAEKLGLPSSVKVHPPKSGSKVSKKNVEKSTKPAIRLKRSTRSSQPLVRLEDVEEEAEAQHSISDNVVNDENHVVGNEAGLQEEENQENEDEIFRLQIVNHFQTDDDNPQRQVTLRDESEDRGGDLNVSGEKLSHEASCSESCLESPHDLLSECETDSPSENIEIQTEDSTSCQKFEPPVRSSPVLDELELLSIEVKALSSVEENLSEKKKLSLSTLLNAKLTEDEKLCGRFVMTSFLTDEIPNLNGQLLHLGESDDSELHLDEVDPASAIVEKDEVSRPESEAIEASEIAPVLKPDVSLKNEPETSVLDSNGSSIKEEEVHSSVVPLPTSVSSPESPHQEILSINLEIKTEDDSVVEAIEPHDNDDLGRLECELKPISPAQRQVPAQEKLSLSELLNAKLTEEENFREKFGKHDLHSKGTRAVLQSNLEGQSEDVSVPERVESSMATIAVLDELELLSIEMKSMQPVKEESSEKANLSLSALLNAKLTEDEKLCGRFVIDNFLTDEISGLSNGQFLRSDESDDSESRLDEPDAESLSAIIRKDVVSTTDATQLSPSSRISSSELSKNEASTLHTESSDETMEEESSYAESPVLPVISPEPAYEGILSESKEIKRTDNSTSNNVEQMDEQMDEEDNSIQESIPVSPVDDILNEEDSGSPEPHSIMTPGSSQNLAIEDETVCETSGIKNPVTEDEVVPPGVEMKGEGSSSPDEALKLDILNDPGLESCTKTMAEVRNETPGDLSQPSSPCGSSHTCEEIGQAPVTDEKIVPDSYPKEPSPGSLESPKPESITNPPSSGISMSEGHGASERDEPAALKEAEEGTVHFINSNPDESQYTQPKDMISTAEALDPESSDEPMEEEQSSPEPPMASVISPESVNEVILSESKEIKSTDNSSSNNVEQMDEQMDEEDNSIQESIPVSPVDDILNEEDSGSPEPHSIMTPGSSQNLAVEDETVCETSGIKNPVTEDEVVPPGVEMKGEGSSSPDEALKLDILDEPGLESCTKAMAEVRNEIPGDLSQPSSPCGSSHTCEEIGQALVTDEKIVPDSYPKEPSPGSLESPKPESITNPPSSGTSISEEQEASERGDPELSSEAEKRTVHIINSNADDSQYTQPKDVLSTAEVVKIPPVVQIPSDELPFKSDRSALDLESSDELTEEKLSSPQSTVAPVISSEPVNEEILSESKEMKSTDNSSSNDVEQTYKQMGEKDQSIHESIRISPAQYSLNKEDLGSPEPLSIVTPCVSQNLPVKDETVCETYGIKNPLTEDEVVPPRIAMKGEGSSSLDEALKLDPLVESGLGFCTNSMAEVRNEIARVRSQPSSPCNSNPLCEEFEPTLVTDNKISSASYPRAPSLGNVEPPKAELFNLPSYSRSNMSEQREASKRGEPGAPKEAKKRTVHFIYSNPDDTQYTQPMVPGMVDSNLRVVYAAAAAQAEDSDEETGTPGKVRLLYAEALGYGGNGVDPPQFVYTATTPDQHILSENQSIYALQPRYINVPAHWDWTPEHVQKMFAEQPPTNLNHHPMQMVQHSSGSVFVQSYADYPCNEDIIARAGDIPNLIHPDHVEHRREICEVFRKHGFYQDPPKGEIPVAPISKIALTEISGTGDGMDGMKLLASASATRVPETIDKESSDAAIEAAKAVAAVGEMARIAREREIKKLREQSQESAPVSNHIASEGTVAQGNPSAAPGGSGKYRLGPRKYYLNNQLNNEISETKKLDLLPKVRYS